MYLFMYLSAYAYISMDMCHFTCLDRGQNTIVSVSSLCLQHELAMVASAFTQWTDHLMCSKPVILYFWL